MTEQLEEFKALLKPYLRAKIFIKIDREVGREIDPQRIAARDELGMAVIRFPADDREVGRIKLALFSLRLLPLGEDEAMQEFSLSMEGAAGISMTRAEIEDMDLWLKQLAASPVRPG